LTPSTIAAFTTPASSVPGENGTAASSGTCLDDQRIGKLTRAAFMLTPPGPARARAQADPRLRAYRANRIACKALLSSESSPGVGSFGANDTVFLPACSIVTDWHTQRSRSAAHKRKSRPGRLFRGTVPFNTRRAPARVAAVSSAGAVAGWRGAFWPRLLPRLARCAGRAALLLSAALA